MEFKDMQQVMKCLKDTQQVQKDGCITTNGQMTTNTQPMRNPINKEAQNLTQQNNSSWTGWTKDEKNAFCAIMLEAFEMQKTYGEVMDLKIRCRAWQRKLGRKFTMEQIISAIEQYTDRNRDFPTPSDINNILDPVKTEISKSEYIAAQKWLETNGYNQFTDQYALVKSFEKQEKEKREVKTIKNSDLLSIDKYSVKNIENN